MKDYTVLVAYGWKYEGFGLPQAVRVVASETQEAGRLVQESLYRGDPLTAHIPQSDFYGVVAIFETKCGVLVEWEY